jgi:hypothetical protein
MEDISPFPSVDDVPSHENIEPILLLLFYAAVVSLVTYLLPSLLKKITMAD